MIKVTINNICAKLTECESLTSGMIGKTLDVELSAEWNNYEKTAVFSNGDVTIDVLESQWSGNTITIPHEVLAKPNRTIVFGMYGFGVENGTTVALPTIYAKIGIPMVGADPTSDPTTDPSLPVYAQLQWQIDHFEISDEQIAQQIQEYLEQHPVEIQPATASVLGGVKVGDGLSVTADGTLSADAPDLSEYAKTADLDDLADIVDGKQDAISDLATIRSGAALGTTALQSVPSTYRTAAQQDIIDNGKQPVGDYALRSELFSGNYNDLSNKPTLFSGNYNDLTNKPTIPTVNDAVLTIKQGGVTKGTFSANSATATTINLDGGGGGGSGAVFRITATNAGASSFTTDKTYLEILDAYNNGYVLELVRGVTAFDFDSYNSAGDFSFYHIDIDDGLAVSSEKYVIRSTNVNSRYFDSVTIPTVPTDVSAFTNDSGYLTLSTLPIYDGSVV